MSRFLVVSHFEVKAIEAAREAGCLEMTASFDLGKSLLSVNLSQEGVAVDRDLVIPWAELTRVSAQEKGCFVWRGSAFEELFSLSETTGWTARLVPTGEAPALHLAGFTMHRMDGISPRKGALEMVNALGAPKGDVLDCATGLGYAAIALARKARTVVSIERDPLVRELSALNPWSEDLFRLPNIQLLSGDSAELIPGMDSDSFAAVLHDPPSLSLAGDLYGGEFYRQLYRILKSGGRLFHYIGDPKSSFGSSVTRGVIRRLGEAGFVKIEPKARAFGLTALKEGRFQRGRRGRLP